MMITEDFMNLVKVRNIPECNYKAIFFKGKTLRIALDPTQKIIELIHPEFYDVKITNQCFGNCKWCYQNSEKDGAHAVGAVKKIKNFFGLMNKNDRPFQVAIGGGEPTLHPEFEQILLTFYDLGITPNYTTNGMFIEKGILEIEKILIYTQLYCGGIAISCHPHLEQFWKNAFIMFKNSNIRINFHIIISDIESIDYFLKIYNLYFEEIDYFVLLPYVSQGRAVQKNVEVKILFDILKNKIKDINKVAFGAGFYSFLKEDNFCQVSLYDPEAFSKYLDLTNMNLYKSSFDTKILKNVS